MESSTSRSFWETICAFSNAVYALFVATIVLLLLTVLSIAHIDAVDRAGRVLIGVNSVLLTAMLLSSTYVIYRCESC